MKKMLKRKAASLLALVLALALAACGGDSTNTESNDASDTADTESVSTVDASETEDAGAVATADEDSYLNSLLNAEPSTLDVARFMDTYSRSILFNILEPLTRIVDGVVTGAGAESWTVSDDGLVYTFTLRENYWSDGEPVVAGDYLYALQRQADPDNAWSLAADMYSIAGFEAVFTGEADISELGVEAPDDSTLVITLESPNSAFLSSTDIFPCRQDYVEEYGDAYGAEASNIIGCGPFNLVEWVHSSSLTFEKNESYWNADEVQLQEFTFYIIEDTNASMASFENGSLDYVYVSSSEYIEKFSADSSLVSEAYSAARSFILVFNCQDEILSNSKIRLAFSLALDRETLAEVITGGTAQAATGLIPPESTVGSYNFRDEAGDLISALQEANPDPQALLIEGMEEAGLGSDPSTLTLTFAWGATTADARTYAELFQQMWQETLGVTVELEFNDSATHMSNVNSGNYQIASTSWGANSEPQFQLSRWATSTGGQSLWVNEEYIQLVNEGVSTMDDAERLELYRQAEELLVSDAAIAPVYWTGSIRFSYSYVQGFSDNVFDTTGMMRMYTSGR